MNNTEFTTYLHEMATNGKIEFSNRETLIDFFSTMMGNTYRMHINNLSIPAVQKSLRSSGEPKIATLMARWWLEGNIPVDSNFSGFFKKLTKTKRLIISCEKDQLYTHILESLNQGENVRDVFPTDIEFEIVEGKTLYRRYY